jgi:hypothetical protein
MAANNLELALEIRVMSLRPFAYRLKPSRPGDWRVSAIWNTVRIALPEMCLVLSASQKGKKLTN